MFPCRRSPSIAPPRLLLRLLSGQEERQQQQICANVNEEGHNNGNYDDIDKAKGGIMKQKVQ